MKPGNALLILSALTTLSSVSARATRRSGYAVQRGENDSVRRRRLKKSKSHSVDKELKSDEDSSSQPTGVPTQTPVATQPVSSPPKSTSQSKKLDDRHELGKGKNRKVPKQKSSKSKKLEGREELDKDKKKKTTTKKSKDCPSFEEVDEPTTSPTSSPKKKSKSHSKGKGKGKSSSPVVLPTQQPSKDHHYLGKTKKMSKDYPETDCVSSTPSPVASPVSTSSPLASSVITASPLASSVTTPSPLPSPTSMPTFPAKQTASPTAAPQPETVPPTLSPIETPTRSPKPPPVPRPVPRPVAPPVPWPVPRPVAPPVSRPVVPPPIIAGAFETTLNLDKVADRFKSAFVNSAAIWDSVIVGDMSDFVVDASVMNSPNMNCDTTTLPDVIDDIFICASVQPIDGPNSILGTAGPTFFRFEDTITSTIGFMNFDEADMDLQREEGTLQGLILHEMAHVYGFGTLWDLNGLAAGTAPCPYKSDSRASDEYRKLSGCDAPIPVEDEFGAGTACLHWDENCFLGELMTGSSSDGLELSTLSIASLEDLGYTVDYSKATAFDTSQMSPSCVCNNRRQLRGSHDPGIFSYQNVGNVPQWASDAHLRSHKPPLSEEGNRIARAHGLSILNANHEWKKAYLRDDLAEHYVGDQIIVVLYMENGYKYSVMVKSHVSLIIVGSRVDELRATNMKAERLLSVLLTVSSFSAAQARHVRESLRVDRNLNVQVVNDLMYLKGSTKTDSTSKKTTRGKGTESSGKGGKGSPTTSKTTSQKTSKGKGSASASPSPTMPSSGKGSGKKSSKKSVDEPTAAPTVHSPSPIVSISTEMPVAAPNVPVPSPVVVPAPVPVPTPVVSPTVSPSAISEPTATPQADTTTAPTTASPTASPTTAEPTSTATPTSIDTESPTASPTTPEPSATTSPTSTDTTAPSQAVTGAPSQEVTTSPAPTITSFPTITAAPSLEPTSTVAPSPPGTSEPSVALTDPPSVDNTSPEPTPVPISEFDTTLGLEQVPDRFQSSFIDAARIWDTVIVGDMPDLVVDSDVLNSPGLNCDPSTLPDVIDDIFICASIIPIDGPFGVLGTAGPQLARFGDTITVTVGGMNFDEADMDLQLEAGTLEGLILHEMAHVYGFGTLWAVNNLASQTSPCPYSYDSRASEQYRLLSGCDASIPVEDNFGAGTQCGHWDEDCFLGELMTGFSTDGLELSILTVAALDDLGYTVDYSRADPFDTSKMSPDCVCNRRELQGTTESDIPEVFTYHNVGKLPISHTSTTSTSSLRPPLSQEGQRIARAHGMAILDANHEWKNAYLKDEQADQYIGDQIIIVLYMENGYKYTVMVTR
ncbi:hypothetical protein FisN_11Lh317 [Fistulifera solaris]|uniref:Leishmanolysin-like peptidase n=1 Tax=Fistulifera solaris TaxID=1519565 RepID=A0A1Z5K0P1_FISSO|nr:hypothetical protein FisN_11Lh317 [Fistulifera solaris]|eukprot:GAX19817.1 hypothetical protein FisN_11Lh317 [Fistulifera solaris]